MPSTGARPGPAENWPDFVDRSSRAARKSGSDQTIVRREKCGKRKPRQAGREGDSRSGQTGLNAPEESTLELRRALPLPAAAPHDVKQQRDASEHDERERLHSHGDFLIGPKGVNL